MSDGKVEGLNESYQQDESAGCLVPRSHVSRLQQAVKISSRFFLPFAECGAKVHSCNSQESICSGSVAIRPLRFCATVASRAGTLHQVATMREKICGVYCFTHIPTGRKYIGSSIDVLGRKDSHIKAISSGSGNYFHRTARKLGIDHFQFEILEICREPGLRLRREKFYIENLNSAYPNGLNIRRDPTIGWNYELDEFSRMRLSEAQTGKRISKLTRAKMSLAGKGRRKSAEHRSAISAALVGNKIWLGRKHKRKTILLMRQKASGQNNGFYGKHHTQEALRKISEHSRGRAPMLGRHHTLKNRRRQSLMMMGNKNLLGHVHSQETVLKISCQSRFYHALRKMISTSCEMFI